MKLETIWENPDNSARVLRDERNGLRFDYDIEHGTCQFSLWSEVGDPYRPRFAQFFNKFMVNGTVEYEGHPYLADRLMPAMTFEILPPYTNRPGTPLIGLPGRNEQGHPFHSIIGEASRIEYADLFARAPQMDAAIRAFLQLYRGKPSAAMRAALDALRDSLAPAVNHSDLTLP